MTTRTLAQEINFAASAKNILLSAVLELTYRCNQRCGFCFQKNYPAIEDLSTEVWKRIIGDLSDNGAFYLTLTGGEPFAREDLLDIVRYARQCGCAVSIISNGTLLDRSKIEALRGMAIMDIGISLLAASAEIHDHLCGVRGSFHKALSTIRMLRKCEINVLIKHTVTSDNFGEYRAIKRIADSEDCLFECDTMVTPASENTIAPEALQPDQLQEFFVDMGVRASHECCIDSAALLAKLHCDAGRSVCGVKAGGDLVPCIMLPIKFGNLTTDAFKRAWNSSAAEDFRIEELKIDSACAECGSNYLCSRCHAIAFMESGNWRGPSESLCRRTQALLSLHRLQDRLLQPSAPEESRSV